MIQTWRSEASAADGSRVSRHLSIQLGRERRRLKSGHADLTDQDEGTSYTFTIFHVRKDNEQNMMTSVAALGWNAAAKG